MFMHFQIQMCICTAKRFLYKKHSHILKDYIPNILHLLCKFQPRKKRCAALVGATLETYLWLYGSTELKKEKNIYIKIYI